MSDLDSQPNLSASDPSLVLELWFIDLAECAAALDELEEITPRIDAVTRARLDRLRLDDVRLARQRSHVALRILLERRLGADVRARPFSYTPEGRPSLANAPIDFSISHAGEASIVAITTVPPVGIDIEPAGRSVMLPPARQNQIVWAGRHIAVGNSPPAHVSPLMAWVRLEAYAKAEGRGIGAVLERVRHHPPANGEHDASAASPFDQEIQVTDLNVGDDYRAAVATARGSGPFAVRRFPGRLDAVQQALAAAGS